jgi:hypothetical protein
MGTSAIRQLIQQSLVVMLDICKLAASVLRGSVSTGKSQLELGCPAGMGSMVTCLPALDKSSYLYNTEMDMSE